MNYLTRPMGLTLMLIMVLMAYEVAVKKPLCINSNMVNKIDRVYVKPESRSQSPVQYNLDSVYSCRALKKTEFSTYFFENAEDLSLRLGKTEILLNSMGLEASTQILIDEVNPEQFSVEAGKIIIGSSLLERKKLEQSLVLASLKSSKPSLAVKNLNLVSEIIADSYSTESIFSEIWKKNWDELGLYQKYKLRQLIFYKISQNLLPETSSITQFMSELVEHPEFSDKTMAQLLRDSFENYGFIASTAPFDAVVQVEKGVHLDLEALQEASKQSNSRIVLQNETGSYILPYFVKLTDEEIANLKITNRVYVAQNKMSAVPFKSFFKNTEKLVVVDAGAKPEELNFKYLFKKDLKNFLATNRKFDFIQFHLPSMQFRASKLVSAQNYFQLLESNKKSEIKKQGLGWESLSWSEDVQAFKPIALYDVIQYFRVN